MTRLTATDLGTVLGVWAHPDDEAYLTAGLMALARRAGQRVVVVTATRGEAGTPDPDAWPPERLARVREAELHASLAALDVTEHHFLDYVDGTLHEQDLAEGIGCIVDLMTEVRPDTVVTFGPDGITGHADHRRVSTWTTVARELAAPDAHLLYATSSASHVDRWRHATDGFDIYMEPDLPLCPPPEQLALEVLLDEPLVDRKMVALRAQASQTTGLIGAMGEQDYRGWISREVFRAAPALIPRPDTAASSAPALSR